ncbi:hypothetical protein [Hydrogenophaga sp.]|uniref:hypothetical protein n=1 Tax=Hydrogenophaga sp. TaxID=1904254 RepID=UPI003F72019D
MSARPPPLGQLPPDALEAMRHRVDAFHDMLLGWLDMPGITLACGRWSGGAISELVPGDGACLLPQRYDGMFIGVRELRLTGVPHHLHIDLGRVERFRFTLAPSVCLGFKPSFEVRLLTSEGEWLLSLMLTTPYDGDSLNLGAASRFLKRACAQLRRHPGLTDIVVEEPVRGTPMGMALLPLLREHAGVEAQDWDEVLRALHPRAAPPVARGDDPIVLPLLRAALALPDATLVIHRDQVLVEFQTERLDGVHRFEEHGHVSWQIGAQHEHHCHLRLASVKDVQFSAQASPCQGGGLNYTLWFQTAESSGNPFRPRGYFSVTLNRPYAHGQPRLEVIQPMLDLYRRFEGAPWVSADEAFLRVLAEGPPARPTRTPHLLEQTP